MFSYVSANRGQKQTPLTRASLKTNSHIQCRAPAVPRRANSHIPCFAPAVLRQCRVLRENPRVAGKIRTANRETPRGSRKKPNLGGSFTGRRETACVNSHIPFLAPAVALTSRKAEWQGHGMVCVNQTRSRCVIQMGKTQSECLATRHGTVCVN